MSASLTLASSSVRLAASRRSRRCCAAAAPCAPDPLALSCCGQQAAPTRDGAALLLEPNAAGQAWLRRGHRAARHHRSPTPNAAFPPQLPRRDATSLSLSHPPSLSRSSLSHTHPLASLYIGPLPPSLSPRKAGPEHHPSSSRWSLLGAASLHERGATRVAVAVSRARKRLLVAARLKRVQPRVAELDVDLGRAEGRVAVGSRQGMRRVAAGVEAVCGQCTVYAQCRGSLGLGLGWDEPRFWI